MTTPVEELVRTTRSRVLRLQEPYLRDQPAAVRTLAVLRRQRSSAAADPEAWEALFDNIPAVLIGKSDEPSDAERALHLSVVLYAVHQQGRPTPVHQSGATLGSAVRRLSDNATDAASVRRFKTLGSASSWAEIAHHLRGLVTQLRGAQIPLDYGLLAGDLFWLQRPATADRVRRRWGRDLHRVTTEENSTPLPTPEPPGASA